MKKSIGFLILVILVGELPGQVTLKYEQNQTLTYEEVIAGYEYLAKNYSIATLLTYGKTDVGKPLHLFVISTDEDFYPESLHRKDRRIVLINNGIHPGEPCGVDASMQIALDILENKKGMQSLLSNTTLCIIPMYNIGGALNRSPYNRANQNGPEEHGFRGNARNLDLNRDFIKMDTKNAWAFIEIFHAWDPDILIDTHTTNGADYQYVLTLIDTQHNKLDDEISSFINQELLPELFSEMKRGPYEMTPYVASFGGSPKNGVVGFMDHPRYTTGYASLFNTMGFITETHMFKPFSDRVLSTYHFIKALLKSVHNHHAEIGKLRVAAIKRTISKTEYTLHWKLDTSRYDDFYFRGYEVKYDSSKLTGQQRYYFDREDPFEQSIKNYRYYSPELIVESPTLYILPQAWHEVADRLLWNGVRMKTISRDTILEVGVYYLDDYKTRQNPYNGHYSHYDTKLRKEKAMVRLYKGDLVVEINQKANNLIVQTLDPRAVDSYFSWNFFDEVLSRKEYFSPYIFEETAEELLKNDQALMDAYMARRSQDESFSSNAYAQLRYIYENSPWSEVTYKRYPIYYINGMNPFKGDILSDVKIKD